MKNKLVLICALLAVYSCSDSKTAKNEKNLQKVKRGMVVSEVKQIMGEPDKVVIIKEEPNVFRFMYKAPFGSSDNFYIMFSPLDSTVKSINYGD